MSAAPFSDRCPECVGPIVLPASWRVVGDQLTGRYRCHACGHGWVTRWLASPADVALLEAALAVSPRAA